MLYLGKILDLILYICIGTFLISYFIEHLNDNPTLQRKLDKVMALVIRIGVYTYIGRIIVFIISFILGGKQ